MSDDEATRLRREIRERQERLEQLEVPQDREAARRLAKHDPDRFNDLVDEGRLSPQVLAGGEKDR